MSAAIMEAPEEASRATLSLLADDALGAFAVRRYIDGDEAFLDVGFALLEARKRHPSDEAFGIWRTVHTPGIERRTASRLMAAAEEWLVISADGQLGRHQVTFSVLRFIVGQRDASNGATLAHLKDQAVVDELRRRVCVEAKSGGVITTARVKAMKRILVDEIAADRERDANAKAETNKAFGGIFAIVDTYRAFRLPFLEYLQFVNDSEMAKSWNENRNELRHIEAVLAEIRRHFDSEAAFIAYRDTHLKFPHIFSDHESFEEYRANALSDDPKRQREAMLQCMWEVEKDDIPKIVAGFKDDYKMMFGTSAEEDATLNGW